VVYIHSTLDWATGLVATIMCGIRSALRIISDKDFDPADMLRLVKKHKVTFMCQPPAHMAQMVNCPEFEGDCLDSLLNFFYGGAACSIEIQKKIYRRLSPEYSFIFSYTFTELCSIVTTNYHFDQKPNSVGRIADGSKIKVLNEQVGSSPQLV